MVPAGSAVSGLVASNACPVMLLMSTAARIWWVFVPAGWMP